MPDCDAKQHNMTRPNVTQFKEGENKATQIDVKKVLSLFLLPSDLDNITLNKLDLKELNTRQLK